MNAISKAIRFFGTQRRFAESLNVSPQAITKWKKSGVPAQRVLEVERATQGTVTRYELRPDLYPREGEAA